MELQPVFKNAVGRRRGQFEIKRDDPRGPLIPIKGDLIRLPLDRVEFRRIGIRGEPQRQHIDRRQSCDIGAGINPKDRIKDRRRILVKFITAGGRRIYIIYCRYLSINTAVTGRGWGISRNGVGRNSHPPGGRSGPGIPDGTSAGVAPVIRLAHFLVGPGIRGQ